MGKKNKKLKFEQVWANLTDIGMGFGLSAVKTGGVLKEVGVRGPDGKPTPEALESRLAVSTPTRSGHEHYMWNRWEVAKILQQQGHSKKVDTRDPVHRVAIEIHKIIKDSEKHEAKGEVKIAIFGYESAADLFHETIDNAAQKKRVQLAARLHDQIAKLTGIGDDLRFLFHGCSVSWEMIQAAKIDAKTPKAHGTPLATRL